MLFLQLLFSIGVALVDFLVFYDLPVFVIERFPPYFAGVSTAVRGILVGLKLRFKVDFGRTEFGFLNLVHEALGFYDHRFVGSVSRHFVCHLLLVVLDSRFSKILIVGGVARPLDIKFTDAAGILIWLRRIADVVQIIIALLVEVRGTDTRLFLVF